MNFFAIFARAIPSTVRNPEPSLIAAANFGSDALEVACNGVCSAVISTNLGTLEKTSDKERARATRV
jgi:hypothetical protein